MNEAACRICRGEALPDDPLYYPCKCTGTIKYVHETCLKEWLEHSGKPAKCELCGHAFRYQSVTRDSIPRHPPLWLLLQTAFASSLMTIKNISLLLTALSMWLFWLPAFVRLLAVQFLQEEAPQTIIADMLANIFLACSEVFSGSALTSKALVPAKELARFVGEGITVTALCFLVVLITLLVNEWTAENMILLQNNNGFNEEDDDDDDDDDEEDDEAEQFRQNMPIFNRQAAFPDLMNDPALLPPEPPAWNAGNRNDMNDDINAELAMGILEFLHLLGPLKELIKSVVASMLIIGVTLYIAVCMPSYLFKMVSRVFYIPTILLTYFPLKTAHAFYSLSKAVLLACISLTSASINGLGLAVFGCKLVPETLINFEGLRKEISDLAWSAIATALPDIDRTLTLTQALHQIRKDRNSWAAVFHGGVIPKETTIYDILFADCCVYIGIALFSCLVLAFARIARKFNSNLIRGNGFIHFVQRFARYNQHLRIIWFLSIELILFPLGCGILIRLALFPLMSPLKSSQSVTEMLSLSFSFKPMFLHWVVGTCYMFFLANFVSHFRRIMRKGVLYFIRDQHDPSFHPFREIFTNSVLQLLRKIGVSAIMYAVLIMFGVGFFAVMVQSTSYVLFGRPFMIVFSGPLFSTPLDLIMCYFTACNVYCMSYLGTVNETIWLVYLDHVCHSLRLSEFILNRKVADEVGSFHYRSLWDRLTLKDSGSLVVSDNLDWSKTTSRSLFILEGSFMRAPAADNMDLEDNAILFIPVDTDDKPIDPKHTPALLKNKQIAPYDVVYRPPFFKTRCLILLLLIFGFTGGLLVLGLFAPIIAGRIFVPETCENDIYAFVVGMFIISQSMTIYAALFSNCVRQSMVDLSHSHAPKTLWIFGLRFAHYALRMSFLTDSISTLMRYGLHFLLLRVVIPLELATLLTLYVRIPLSSFADSTLETIDLMQDFYYCFIFVEVAFNILVLSERLDESYTNELLVYLKGTINELKYGKLFWALVSISLKCMLFIAVPVIAIAIKLYSYGPLTVPEGRSVLYQCALTMIGLAILRGIAILVDHWEYKTFERMSIIKRKLLNIDEYEPERAN
ncbi:hypothetical protein CANCADRAFT_144289 [Tortispora caseinolytica NRRL Y-17796]|uniref:RING-type E3 ubiquitin transferase n=1 Tax=Tortispora caseinolytica NRRL Y-17796 TaxID=767744 RepID=A0A1E4TDI0_9ASCO|nr:hypothetical protein CANCADRAFT_144289 [Tortispora caseinolytica NRRL Y-17796]